MEEPKITPELIREHGLSDEEWQRMLDILGREPTFTELGVISSMWSEHCSYKSSRIHLSKFPTEGPQVLQGPGENAGIVDIGDNLAICFKMESHNHPSYIEPYQGAATGVGGILRDVFTMGARPIANLNSLRFGEPDHPKTPYLLQGVVAGIAGYGNCIGVPTVGGETTFDPSYNGNILVNAFTLGLVRHDRIFKGFASGPGNPVIYVGAKTGRDGIHGATMASEEFSDETEAKRPTVQVGDPFMEKLLLEACMELFEKDCLVGIQDMGAVGLTSSALEMAERAGTGMVLDLDKIPVREENMTAYELMLSESQERMLLVAKRGQEKEVYDIFRKWDLEAHEVGLVTDDGRFVLNYQGEKVGDMPVNAISDQAPMYDRPQIRPGWQDEVQQLDEDSLPEPTDLGQTLLDMMASPNLALDKWVWRQYDHMVHTNTAQRPGGDAAVVRVKGTRKGIGMSVDCNPRYCYLDPRAGAYLAVAEAARNLSCSGALPLAITDCLNFGNPEKPEIMWQFAQAVEGMSEACKDFDTPVISGNVSFYNETDGKAIYPTPAVAMAGLVEDMNHVVGSHFEQTGDHVLLLGSTQGHIGGSEYLSVIHGKVAGCPPAIDTDTEKRLQKFLRQAAKEHLLSSTHDISDGGLAVALAECCLKPEGPGLGLTVTHQARIRRSDFYFFGEDTSRAIVSSPAESIDALMTLAGRLGIETAHLGRVGGDRLAFDPYFNLSLDELYRAWSGTVPKIAGD